MKYNNNNVRIPEPQCEIVYTQDYNVRKEKRSHIDSIRSNENFDEICSLSEQNSDLHQGHRCHADLSNATCLMNSQAIIEAIVMSKVCIVNMNVHNIDNKSENIKCVYRNRTML